MNTQLTSMYLSHYGLREKPFQITTDPKFLWLGEKHKEALATLKYGVLDRRGFLLLTGDVGTGKTTLIKTLVKDLSQDVVVATVVDPGLERIEFFTLLAQAFYLPGKPTNKLEFLNQFKVFLNETHAEGKTVLLIIDEAQKLSPELLEEVRLLSNIEREDSKLLNIFFIGQNEFNDILANCTALRQRITIMHHLQPLTEAETKAYIQHRLEVAGTTTRLFDKKAIRRIYSFSRGYPRLINIICDHALLTGFVRELKTIGPSIIKECQRELTLQREATTHQPETSLQYTKPERKRSVWWPLLYTTLAMLVLVSTYFLFNQESYQPYIENTRDYYRRLWSPHQEEIIHRPIAPLEEPSREDDIPETQDSPDTVAPDGSPEMTRHGELPPVLPEMGRDFDVESPPVAPVNATETITRPVDQPPTGNQVPTQARTTVTIDETFRAVIPFDFNTNEISPPARRELDDLASAMAADEDLEILVTGYTDALGSHHFNIKLSEFRALVVKSYLVGKGIDSARIETMGLAEKDPIESNETVIGRAANRRVEIQVKGN